MATAGNPSAYDLLREKLDARDLLARLGLDVVSEMGAEIQVRPICHESQSGNSLHVNAHSGRWICRACEYRGVYGDLIQLVEYARTGGQPPTHGPAQRDSATHLDAMQWVCGQYAIPFGKRENFSDAALDAVHLFAMEAHRYLLTRDDVMQWVLTQWGFDRSIVEDYGIGFMPSPMLPSIAQEAVRKESRRAFDSSGLGWYAPDGRFDSHFAGRITFPYLEHGRAVYLIGRSTPWTPERANAQRVAKYHKLRVHSEKSPHISKSITNDHLYNERVMRGATTVVVAEGIADAVALSAMGVPVVSPVTVNFNRTDKDRFIRFAAKHGIERVEIVFDNEMGGVGGHSAVRTAQALVEGGMRASVITLPLGEDERAARDELRAAMGDELFERFEASDPSERRDLIAESFRDEAKREWVKKQVSATKIDVAEWAAREGVGAAARFDAIRKKARDVVEMQIHALAENVDPDDEPSIRLEAFYDALRLAAHVDDRLMRASYAASVSKLAGKGVDKAAALQRISHLRREIVKPERKAKDEKAAAEERAAVELVLLPPDSTHNPAPAPPPPPSAPPKPGQAPPPPAPPKQESEHERLASVRASVAQSIEAKFPKEMIGEHVADTIKVSMGYTPFQCPDELYLVRGNERIPVGQSGSSPRFDRLLYTASGLTKKESAHRGYIAATEYFLALDAPQADEVSWSYVEHHTATTYFPTGDRQGRMLQIERGKLTRTRMANARVPAVAGASFSPFAYTEDGGGIDATLRVFRWTSLSESDRMLLIYWLVCLPVLRTIGQIPIVRIEGGSSSGKTRAVDAVSYLVNGRKSASVPTAAAMISLLSTEMLTIDDNRESDEMPHGMKGTLLQATQLGAREKRKGGSDTGTVVERVCGGLLMNGIEPIHDGRGELASRIFTLRCSPRYRTDDSPTASEVLLAAILEVRDGFWSEACRRCADALALDVDHGEALGEQIDEAFGATRIGRLSRYLRMMYLAWVVGLPDGTREEALATLAPKWVDAFGAISRASLDSLVGEELAVTAIRYAFDHGRHAAAGEKEASPGIWSALDGRFEIDVIRRTETLGPISGASLARLVRSAGKELNAPRAIASDLRTGQLEARILDGIDYLADAGFDVRAETTQRGKTRFTISREIGDEWDGPSVDSPPSVTGTTPAGVAPAAPGSALDDSGIQDSPAPQADDSGGYTRSDPRADLGFTPY